MSTKLDRPALKELQAVAKAADSLTSALSALKKKLASIEVSNHHLIVTHVAEIQNFMTCVEGALATLVPTSLTIIAESARQRIDSGKAAAARASNGE